jgi:short chain dehydrogenase
MQAITVSDRDAGVAGLSLTDLPHPQAADNDVVVRVHAAGFTPGELDWPHTWIDRAGRDRTPATSRRCAATCPVRNPPWPAALGRDRTIPSAVIVHPPNGTRKRPTFASTALSIHAWVHGGALLIRVNRFCQLHPKGQRLSRSRQGELAGELPMHFEAKKVIVVGGSAGMGRQIRVDVVEHRANAVIIGRSKNRVGDTVAELASRQGEAWGIAAKLADHAAVADVNARMPSSAATRHCWSRRPDETN